MFVYQIIDWSFIMQLMGCVKFEIFICNVQSYVYVYSFYNFYKNNYFDIICWFDLQ